MENKLTSVSFPHRKENFKIKKTRKLLFLFCTIVFGLLPSTVLSQTANIKIDQDKTASVDEVFNLIMSQTNYTFIYQVQQFKNYPKVKLEKGTIQADELLKKTLSSGNFNYNFTGNTIVINEIPKLKDNSEITISGKVTDKNGLSIPGISVYASSSNKTSGETPDKNFVVRGTVTDFDGSFSIKAQSGYYMFATGVGYDLYSEPITSNKKNYTIVLKEKVSQLEQVIVVGYGTTKKKDLTGAIGSVKAEEITQVKTQTIDQALGGRVSGVYVSPLSGRPGAGAAVNIRGLTSLRGDNQPLYVVDGIPITINPSFESNGLGSSGVRENPLMAINPNDVERVDILKDASAAAIYGSRAANGVIIVTTKRGKRNQKPQFNFSVNSTFQNPTSRFDFLNADQYRAFQTTYAQNRIAQGQGTPADNAIIDGTFFGNANTDWQKKILNQNALWNEYRFNVMGGSENVNYLVAANVTDQEGMMIGTKFKRYNFASNLDATITEHFKVGASINYNYSINKTSNVNGLMMGNFRPDLDVYQDNGEYTTSPALLGPNPTSRNPVGGEGLAKNNTAAQNIFGSVYGEIKIIEGLNFKSLLSIAANNDETNNFMPSFSQLAGQDPVDGSAEATLLVQHNKGYSTSFSNTLNYIKKFESGHSIDAVVGISWDQSRLDLQAQNYAGFPDDFILTNVGSASRATTYQSEALENGLNSVFGRFNYIYKDRYLATFTARRDGSTKFGTNNQYGFFPSGALAWNVHNEAFFKSKVINQLKLRASLGRTGSDNLASFSYLAYLNSLAGGNSIYANVNGIVVNSIPNNNIKWEETNQLDFGLEFGLFNNRLNGEVGYFKKKTNGIILYTPVPSETGTSRYNSNIADVSNKGWEITLGGDVIRGGAFKWNSSFNISFVKNNVDHLNGGSVLAGGSSPSIVEGQPIGVIMGYEVVGIAQNQAQINALNAGSPTGSYYGNLSQPGDYIFRDVNGDGRINADDRKPLGNLNPNYFGGWNNTMTYKNFSFSFNFQYSQGNQKQVNLGDFMGEPNPQFNVSNTTTIVYDTWTPENPNATYGRVGVASEGVAISKYVGDASYIRLRSTSFGYNFPRQWLDKTEIANMRLSLSANNLFTISNYIGIDPESVVQPRAGSQTTDLNQDSTYSYPMAKSFTIGLNVTF
ncbi:TonB-linked SusC/RagA family outer membrane protein [Flavobacterium sp. 90]|uniref:SusC/RagA family TonB-linked outer membrane protein n=1 Tax=unclassified Flavobacterium TaxID=196869 RepID=UPI000EAD3678|nr:MULTISPECIES: TonB-dependent receptor [unclassified Flavobacterium]RKR05096.1 TonB-linked SusC/RagA family outer membrane protein [Flavobacterium sp. 81]TCK56412.1 TonB-linked SusC/RagA family outer membrane protein [Flavobacterium sp. 90]